MQSGEELDFSFLHAAGQGFVSGLLRFPPGNGKQGLILRLIQQELRRF
jgi:hypothetical protein